MKWFKKQEEGDKTYGYLDVNRKFYQKKEDRDSANKEIRVRCLKQGLINALDNAKSNIEVINREPFKMVSAEHFITTLIQGDQLDGFFWIYEQYRNGIAKIYNDENS